MCLAGRAKFGGNKLGGKGTHGVTCDTGLSSRAELAKGIVARLKRIVRTRWLRIVPISRDHMIKAGGIPRGR